MVKRYLVVLFACTWFLLGGVASAAGGQVSAPEQLVRQTTRKVLDILNSHQAEVKSNPNKVADLVRNVVLPHFDFVLMSRFVLARHWRTASQAQQQRFVKEFQTLLVRTYSKSLSEYSGQKIEFKPMHGDVSRGRVSVGTLIVEGSGNKIPVDYRLHKVGNEWKVYDVVIDGVSLVQNYRSSFGDELRNISLDRLMDRIAKRNNQQSGQ